LHAPQLKGSAVRLASQPSSFDPLQSPRPALQVNPQSPAVHLATPNGTPGHSVPHAPQFVVLVCVSTHCPAQFTSGDVQLTTHCPPWQTLPSPQALPQAPQWLLLVCVFTQDVPQRV
jgi:hypothetical protein